MKLSVHALGLIVAMGSLAVTPSRARAVTVRGHVTLVNPGKASKHPDDSNVVVWLTPLSASWDQLREAQAQSDPRRFRIVQKHKQFDPHLLVVPLGAAVEFPNLDPLFHNVFSLFEGKRFDLGLYEAGTTRTVKFDRPGVSYIFCNIHSEMSAVVVVVKSPYYGISGPAGEIKISNVIPGRYRLEVWHERALPETLKSLSREITVQENSGFFGDVRLPLTRGLIPPHKNKYGHDYDEPTPPEPLYEQP
jgi:plastocyanin